MKRQWQRGSLTKSKGKLYAQWREGGRHRKKLLGPASMRHGEARAMLAELVRRASETTAHDPKLSEFIADTYLPFYLRKWKGSTYDTVAGHMRDYVLPELGGRKLSWFTRDKMQNFLDDLGERGLSHNLINHVRWDLSQIFELARSEGAIPLNPAKVLFVPRSARKPDKRFLTMPELMRIFNLFDLPERLVLKLASLSGMRPGEVFALRWGAVHDDHVKIERRVYQGKLDSPKTQQSIRDAAISESTARDFAEWHNRLIVHKPDFWVFPSENLRTPVRPHNMWRRRINPILKRAGYERVNYQVMRRTHATLMRENKVDPKIVADQLGHGLGVDLNVYTQTSLKQKSEAVDKLERSGRVM